MNNQYLHVRLKGRENEIVKVLTRQLDLSRSEVARQGINLLYQQTCGISTEPKFKFAVLDLGGGHYHFPSVCTVLEVAEDGVKLVSVASALKRGMVGNISDMIASYKDRQPGYYLINHITNQDAYLGDGFQSAIGRELSQVCGVFCDE